MDEQQTMTHIMKMQQDIAALTEQIKAAFKRIDEQKQLTEAVSDLAASVRVQANELKRMNEDQARLRSDVDTMRMQSGKRWETVVGQIIALVVSAAAGGAFLKLFGG